MPWSAATAATAKCKRQFIGFARRRISTTVSPWTCSAIPKRRTELKLLKPSTTSERGKKVPLMMLKTPFNAFTCEVVGTGATQQLVLQSGTNTEAGTVSPISSVRIQNAESNNAAVPLKLGEDNGGRSE